jgi:hypothetical protein
MAPHCATERWRPAPGYEERYEVSDWGRVRSLPRQSGDDTPTPLIMRQQPNSKGYPRVPLRRDGRMRQEFVHLLVATAFLGPCPDGQEVHHKDETPAHAALSNLEYVTHGENVAIAWGARAGLDAADVAEIRSGGWSQAQLAARFGVSTATIRKIRLGETARYAES